MIELVIWFTVLVISVLLHELGHWLAIYWTKGMAVNCYFVMEGWIPYLEIGSEEDYKGIQKGHMSLILYSGIITGLGFILASMPLFSNLLGIGLFLAYVSGCFWDLRLLMRLNDEQKNPSEL